jgi:uncharacterized protein
MGKLPAEKVPRVEIADQRQGSGWKLLLVVSADHLTASVQISRTSAGADCPAEKVVELVRGSKLRLSKDEDTQLPELARALVKGGSSGGVVVAKGSPAEKWKDIDWLIPIGISALRDYSEETVDLHEVSQFINVRLGQVLCEWPSPPKPGCTVFGEAIPTDPCPFQLGDRVALDEGKTSRVLAAQPGCVRFVGGRLSVEQHLEIPGDLDFKIGNIDFCGDVTIHGNVLDGFHVKSAKNIVVEGSVGASTIEAAGNVTIKGGVNGAHKGRLLAGGDMQAHYLHMVSVECGRDILVDVECHDSSVLAAGSVTVARGGIIGGKVLAGTDIRAGFIGAEMCVPTVVHAGYQSELDARVEKARKALAHARALLKNLESAHAKCVDQPGFSNRFPSQRKTQGIQLQSRLADARTVAKRAQSELAAQTRGTALVGATISSMKQVFPKVTLVIDSVCEEEVAMDMDGPVRLLADVDQLVIKPVAGKASMSK